MTNDTNMIGRTGWFAAALALFAALALLAGPSAVSAAAGTGATATAAKKCKAAKKKKCKKPRSVVRATLNWTSDNDNADLDLFVFDAKGNRGNAATNAIPSSSFSPNQVGTSGKETFTDRAFGKSGGRQLSYGVCFRDIGSVHATYTIDYVTADGKHHSDTHEFGSSGVSKDYPGGAPIPSGYCN